MALRRPLRALPIAIALLFSAGCHAPSAEADDTDAADEAETPRATAALRRAVEVARAKLVLLELEQVEAQAKRNAEIAAAMREVSAAEVARHTHRERAAPLARAEAEHALEESRTAVHDAEEELVQLKLMYAEQDLADATRELVLARSERRLAAAKQAVALEERKLLLLIEVEQPAAEGALSSTVLEASEELRAAHEDDALATRAAALAHMEAAHALAEAEEALHDALAEAEEALHDALGDGDDERGDVEPAP